ncbi:unnamed protein product [Psylliodes chrysocephalus]|uniref:Uncharacterized protein n=1 Tax=Psylliodes chrysocephalus TaxID=3402493 RepID=A0A9P0GHZ5_9CUCU|nr:unnamed protein product [Psylliodes chrysocephala]
MTAKKGLAEAQLLQILESDDFFIDSVLDESACDNEEHDFVTEVEEVGDIITDNKYPDSNDLEDLAGTNDVLCDQHVYKAKDGNLWSKTPNTDSKQEKIAVLEKYEIHIRKKDISRIEKEADKNNEDPFTKVIVYDMQAILPMIVNISLTKVGQTMLRPLYYLKILRRLPIFPSLDKGTNNPNLEDEGKTLRI